MQDRPSRHRFHRILLATDLSPASAAATDEAIELARALVAELIVVNVVDGGRSPVDQARALATRAGQAGIATMFLTWRGSPGEAIVDAAASEGVDLIVIGSRGLGPMSRLLLGSVSRHVVEHARCPVLVARPHP